LHGSIAASVIAIIGLFNLPLMKFSVDWWNTIHQIESFSYESTSIYIVNLIRILLLIILFFFYILFLFFIRFRIILLNRKVYSILNKL
jgi:heme exporter protein C